MDPPLIVLVNALHAKAGGGITHLRNLVPRLAERPDVRLHLCLHESQRGSLGDVPEAVSIHYLDFPSGFWRLLVREQVEVPKLARAIGADVVFSPANYGPLGLRNGVVFLRNALSVGLVERRPAKIAYWALLYLATLASLVRCRRALAVSDYALASLGWPGRLLRRRLTVVPHGVAPTFTPPPAGAEREDFLLAVSDLYVQKNLHRLIRALSRLKARHPAIRLKVAGTPVDADYAGSLRRLVAEAGLEGQVEFLGRQDPEALVDLYRRCRAFVFPSTVETFGNPLAEAMACGCPVACSDTAAMPEVAGDAALFFDPDDVGGMADALDRLLGDPDLRADLSARAVERAGRYSWDRTAEATLEVLRLSASSRGCR